MGARSSTPRRRKQDNTVTFIHDNRYTPAANPPMNMRNVTPRYPPINGEPSESVVHRHEHYWSPQPYRPRQSMSPAYPPPCIDTSSRYTSPRSAPASPAMRHATRPYSLDTSQGPNLHRVSSVSSFVHETADSDAPPMMVRVHSSVAINTNNQFYTHDLAHQLAPTPKKRYCQGTPYDREPLNAADDYYPRIATSARVNDIPNTLYRHENFPPPDVPERRPNPTVDPDRRACERIHTRISSQISRQRLN